MDSWSDPNTVYYLAVMNANTKRERDLNSDMYFYAVLAARGSYSVSSLNWAKLQQVAFNLLQMPV